MPVDVAAVRDEQLVSAFGGAELLQPRGSAGEKVSTAVDVGTVLITTRRVLFHGKSKSAVWALDKLLPACRAGRTGLLLPVASREGIYGLDRGTLDRLVELWTLVAWAATSRDASHGGFPEALRVVAVKMDLPGPTIKPIESSAVRTSDHRPTA